MRFSLLLLSVLAGTLIAAHAGTPRQADGVRRLYEADFKQWVLRLQVASSAEERRKSAGRAPASGRTPRPRRRKCGR